MDEFSSLNFWLAGARAIHIGACLLALGLFLFDRLVVSAVRAQAAEWLRIARTLAPIAFSLALLSGLLWFGLVAIAMSDLPIREALQWDTLQTVWAETTFGRVWQVRAILLLVSFFFALPATLLQPASILRSLFSWLALFAAAALTISLAWAGHGQFNGSLPHLAADASHLLVCALWPIGLLPFGLLLARLKNKGGPQAWLALTSLTRRFSALSVVGVLIVTVTGILNSLPLVGSFACLVSSQYGKLLLLKVAFFSIAVAIGAVNLLYLKPRVIGAASTESGAQPMKNMGRLRINVWFEIVLGAITIVIVGLLGLLPPAIEHLMHHHH